MGEVVSASRQLAGNATAWPGARATSGATVNASLISDLNFPGCIAVISPVPQLNVATVGNQSVLFYPYSAAGTDYVLQSATNLASPNWLVVTNAVPIIGVTVSNNLPASFFRLVPGQ